MRDKDVREAIQRLLQNTNQFDAVALTGPPEQFTGASSGSAVWIEPDSSNYAPKWDTSSIGDVVVTSTCRITFAVRAQDPQLRDETAELLVDVANNAISGRSLAGFTMPDMTRPLSWKWRPPKPPERRVEMTFQYCYLLQAGWFTADTTP